MTISSATNAITTFLDAMASGDVQVVDLTNKLSAQTPVLRLPAPFANLIDFSIEEVSAYDETGPFWKHNNIHTGEHIGTHLDAPIHWASGRGGDDVSQIPVQRLIGPIAVIDMSQDAAQNPDFLLEIEHVKEWEEQHGVLPEDGWLLYRTGWDRFADDQAAFLNITDEISHTPGVSAACAKWLAEETPIAGFGVETVGIDAGNAFVMDPPMPAHHYFMGNDKYGITSLQNLAQLPPTGALIVVCPLPIVGGTGSPSRVLAVVPRTGA